MSSPFQDPAVQTALGGLLLTAIEFVRRQLIRESAHSAVDEARRRHPEKPIRSSRLHASARDHLESLPRYRRPLTKKGQLREIVRALDAREAAEREGRRR